MTYILGIESSCDETGVAIVQDGTQIISGIVKTQTIHEEYGGVVPDLSSREHMKIIDRIAEQAINTSGLIMEDIDAIAVVNGPGLVGSLMIGLMYAKGLALRYNKPLISVNHILSHIYANILTYKEVDFPLIALVASGGHSSLFYVKEDFSMKIIGKTLDDAAGEAFDKCAKMLGLGYPGGPAIQKYAENGNPNFYKFPRARIKNYDFSFSGLKTSVLYYINEKGEEFVKENIHNIAASVQEAIVDQLINKLIISAKDYNIRNIAIAGGVSANKRLREKLQYIAKKNSLHLYIPEFKYCTDNGEVVAGIGYIYYKNKDFSNMKLNVYSR